MKAKKPATKKPATKKPATKKPATKKPAAKSPAAKKPAAKKPAAKKPAAKKPEAKKPAAKKPRYSAATRPEQRSTPRASASDRERLLQAVDIMQLAMRGMTATAKAPPESRGRTPWMMVVRFGMPALTTYDDVWVVLRNWRDSERIESRVGPQRLSRIQARYKTNRGKEGDYTLAEIGPWELVVSRAYERVGVRDVRDAPLIARYGDGGSKQSKPSEVKSLYVWFSATDSERVT